MTIRQPVRNMTYHSSVRANQRGINNERLSALLNIADIDVPVGRRLSARRVSRAALHEAIKEGLPPSQADRLKRLAVIEADDGAIVSVASVYGRKGRRYKRRVSNYWKGYVL